MPVSRGQGSIGWGEWQGREFRYPSGCTRQPAGPFLAPCALVTIRDRVGTEFRLPVGPQVSIASAKPTCGCVLGVHNLQGILEGKNSESVILTEANEVIQVRGSET